MLTRCIICSKFVRVKDSLISKLIFWVEEAFIVYYIYNSDSEIKQAYLFTCENDCKWIENNSTAASAILKSKILALNKK